MDQAQYTTLPARNDFELYSPPMHQEQDVSDPWNDELLNMVKRRTRNAFTTCFSEHFTEFV